MGTASEHTLRQILAELEDFVSGSFAPEDAEYVVLALDTGLSQESLITSCVKYSRQVLFYDPKDPIVVGTNKIATIVYRGPTLTLVRWDMRVKTAPTGAAMIFDVNMGGTSLWNTTQANRPTIADAGTSGTGTSFDTTTLSDGDVLTLDYDQVGSGTAGGQVTLILEGECNLEVD